VEKRIDYNHGTRTLFSGGGGQEQAVSKQDWICSGTRLVLSQVSQKNADFVKKIHVFCCFLCCCSSETSVSKQLYYLRQRQKPNPAVFRLIHREYLRYFYAGKAVKPRQGMVVLAQEREPGGSSKR
jgi:hypothetical protein